VRLGSVARRLALCAFFGLATICQLAPALAHAQQTESANKPAKNELAVEGGGSFGNWQIFAYAEDRQVSTYGLEYDHLLWGRVLGTQVDYTAELLPVVLLSEPAEYKSDSTALTTARQLKYGADASPAGFRLLWRQGKAFEPYFGAKGGVAYFKERILSPQDTHLQFTAQFGFGFEHRFTQRMAFRAGFSEFHISNGDIARNPGVDLMYVNGQLSFRLGR
jgi:hypothetical protein